MAGSHRSQIVVAGVIVIGLLGAYDAIIQYGVAHRWPAG